MTRQEQVFIGLGSNLEDPEKQISTAIDTLNNHPAIHITNVSSLYKSKPVGPQDQPDFVNGVVNINTHLQPTQLLRELKQIEISQGRKVTRKWGERIIDLDILLYGDQVFDTNELTIPHKELLNRDFALLPILEISPNAQLPDGSVLSTYTRTCPSNDLVKINSKI